MESKQITLTYKGICVRLKSHNRKRLLYMPAGKSVKVWMKSAKPVLFFDKFDNFTEIQVTSLTHGEAIDFVLELTKKKIDRLLNEEKIRDNEVDRIAEILTRGAK